MTGTLDEKPLAPAANAGAAAARPATAPPATPQHPQPLAVIMLPGEIDTSNDGQVHDMLVLGGDIDEETYPALIEALNHVPRDNASLHIDLSDVTFCDLAGLRAIVWLADTTMPVMLHGVPRPLRTVMEILGWDQRPGLVISKPEHGRPARRCAWAGPPAVQPAHLR